MQEFRSANWLSSYCLEPWQTNRYQICGHYVSSCILHLFSPHFYPLGRDVFSQDQPCYPRTHLIALQLNVCAACSLLLFSHLTKILCLKNSWVEDVLCLSPNWCAVQQLYCRKSLQPDSVTLPSVGCGGLRGLESERLLSSASASPLSQGVTEFGCLKLNLRKDCITPSRMLFLSSFAKLIHVSSALTWLI